MSLDPVITELVCYFGLGESLVGVSHNCLLPEEGQAERVTTNQGSASKPLLEQGLSSARPDLKRIKELAPDLLLAFPPYQEQWSEQLKALKEAFAALGLPATKLLCYSPRTLDQVYDFFVSVGRDLGIEAQGRALASRLKAQVMDWCDNFYERMKNKKVSLITSCDPLTLGGFWMPGMVALCSAHSQVRVSGKPSQRVEWHEIVQFAPDVIVIAPWNMDAKQAALQYRNFERRPDWEKIPAVKRGEVYFSDGLDHFNRPTPKLIDSMGILVSAIAGLESGYITARDSFYKLRWVELHRHKFERGK